MTQSTIISKQAWCGHPGCTGRPIGAVRVRHHDGQSVLDLSRSWTWNGEVDPPRWQRRSHSRNRGIPAPAVRGAAELRADLGKVGSGYGRIRSGVALTVPLPCMVQCPKCRHVQEVADPDTDSLGLLHS